MCLIGVLKGAWLFLADLVRCLEVPVTCDFIGVASYGQQKTSTGKVRPTLDLDVPIVDLHVMLVEDIVETGLTMRFLYDILARHKPRDLRTCMLLDKPSRRRIPFIPDYIGFTIPDHFVVGYGLDFRGAYRNLPHIAIYPAPEAIAATAL
ncbi:Hypoxanthine phosphoribosyltransferase [Candidatus Entotheonellaceae bacterium PAL068K]